MKKHIALGLFLFMTFACAGNPYPLRPFDPALHGSPAVEWAPHAQGVEWWYVTGIVNDSEGRRYFYQFTIFHGFRLGAIEGFVSHLALTDVAAGKHYFYEDFAQPNNRVYGSEKTIALKDSAVMIETDDKGISRLSLSGTAPGFSLTLGLTPAKPAAWHGEKGIIVMGQPEKSRERSFYYSFTNMQTEGQLILSGKKIPVKGSSWFDRQWGAFTESAWDWFSLRLNDGREFMLFGFPGTGFNAGTLVAPDGAAAPVASFQYEKLGSMRFTAPGGATYILGWRVKLPSGEEFRILPMLADQFNPAQNTPPYWEGLCEVFSANGEKLGFCIMETTAGAQ
jgi:predicted secreted hydrolase